jgi:ribosomal protein S18 acetylase RimI-like enzyme
VTDEPTFRRVSPELAEPLTVFFALLVEHGIDRVFHPHPFTPAEARRRARYSGLDEYHVGLRRNEVIAYGLLRGWDEGYDTPSLGIAVSPRSQRNGIGRRLMEHLHDVARARGATRVRLKVYRENTPAVRLYEAFGYSFEAKGDELIGVRKL